MSHLDVTASLSPLPCSPPMKNIASLQKTSLGGGRGEGAVLRMGNVACLHAHALT